MVVMLIMLIMIIEKQNFKYQTRNYISPTVTLSTKDNLKLTKWLNEGFKRPFYWNEYKTQIESKGLSN